MLRLIRQALHSGRPNICDDAAAWGRKQGLAVSDIYEPIYQEILPLTLQDAVARTEFEFHEADYKRPQSLVLIPRARVRDAAGFVFLPDGSVCSQGNWFRPYVTENPSYQALFRKKRFVKGDVFSLLGLWSGEFCHWFHDTLPRLCNSLPHLIPASRISSEYLLQIVEETAFSNAILQVRRSPDSKIRVSSKIRRLLGRLSRWLTLETHYRRILEAEMRGRLKAKNVIERDS